MREISRFRMYYFSEVSADILYRYLPDREIYKISATHTNTQVPISDWFHFCDVEIDARDDPLVFESADRMTPLAKMADTLSKGPEVILQRRELQDTRRQFFSDFMYAFFFDGYNITDDRRIDITNPAGNRLMEYADRKI